MLKLVQNNKNVAETKVWVRKKSKKRQWEDEIETQKEKLF